MVEGTRSYQLFLQLRFSPGSIDEIVDIVRLVFEFGFGGNGNIFCLAKSLEADKFILGWLAASKVSIYLVLHTSRNGESEHIRKGEVLVALP